MKRLNKILSAVQKFASKDYTARYINGIKFDLNRQTIEATDGHAAIILKGSRGFVAGMANDYAEHLGIDPVGSDFGIVKLAPKNGKKFPVAERLPEEANHRGDLHTCLCFGEHDPEICSSTIILNDQLPRLKAICKALRVTLHLNPGLNRTHASMQYGKSSYNGEEILFCIAQMPCHLSKYDENGDQKTTTVTYSPLDETERDAMKQFKKGETGMTENFYFNFAYSMNGKKSKYHDMFCRVTVPSGPDAAKVALEKFSAKFKRNEWGFQYTQAEFDTFPSKPWWKGTERVVDFDDLR